MSISRRAFFRLVPASVGAIAFGGMVLPASAPAKGVFAPHSGRRLGSSLVSIDQAFVRQYERKVRLIFKNHGSYLKDAMNLE